jgi:predicted dehydrogenase
MPDYKADLNNKDGSSTLTGKFRWAIIGTGNVAAKFAIGMRSVPGAEVSLVASRSAERAAEFARRFKISHSVGGYQKAAHADVNAAYIATPPSEHRGNAQLFLDAGKPVLIEKPLAANASEARELIDAARAAGVFCMEGMWTRFLPALAKAREIIARGDIGTPRALCATFATAETVDPANPLFRPDLGGGALGHRGVYPLSLATDLLGPAILASAIVTRGVTGVDEEASALLRHANGAMSSVYTSARTSDTNSLSVLGTEGSLRFVGPIYRPFGLSIEVVHTRQRSVNNWGLTAILKEGPLAQGLRQWVGGAIGDRPKRDFIRAPYIGNGYAHEAMAVMEAVAKGWTEHPIMPLDASAAVARLIDEIKATSPTS